MQKKKKNRKKSTTFDAYKYANHFEKLSLEIVKLIYKDSFNGSEVIYGDTTQTTRDYGVDAYLVVNIKDRLQTYTVEAKLRTSDPLSLKDFATSILYYLINTSSRHFIVTNVSYSHEAIKYIQQSNSRNEKVIELIDGQLLQNVINTSLKQFYDFPKELIDYILNRKCKTTSLVSGHNSIQQNDKNYVELPYYSVLLEDVRLRFQLGHNFFVITGGSGTGKSSWIKYCVDKVFGNYVIQKFDVSLIQTPKLFVLEILRILLGFNVEKLFTDLSKDKNLINDMINQFQMFPCDSEQIADAVRFLLISKDNDQKTYVYFMHILMEHLKKNFLVNMHTVVVIENLHEATTEMIDFVIRTMYCLGQENIIVFWEILTPQNPSQLFHVSFEQWYDFIYLLTSKNLGQKTLPYHISLNGLLEDKEYGEIEENIKGMLAQYIPGIAFTSEFINAFIKYFGLNIRNIFEAFNIIKIKDLYSAAAIKDLHMNSSIMVEKQIIDLMCAKPENKDFYQRIFNFVYLLDGKLESATMQYLDRTFGTDTNKTLTDSGLFYRENNTLYFQYYNMITTLKRYFNPNVQKECAKWLLEHMDEFDFNYIERKYYELFFLYIVLPSDAMCRIDETIEYLSRRKVYKYVLSLSRIRYEYYKQANEEVLYYQYWVQYIYYLRAATSDLNVLNTNIKAVESLRCRLAIKYWNDKRYVQTNLKLALIQYHVSKANYNYDDCEEKIQYILNYEDDFEDSELFIIARIYHALIKKEQGFRKEFVLELIDNFQKYPDNLDVKITYYINLAAMYKFTHKQIAIKLVRTAKELTFDSQQGYGDLEVEMNLLHLLCQEGSEVSLEHIKFIRSAAEKVNSMYILAKTFNLEAYYYIKNFCDNEEAIIQCLKSAIFHSLSNGQTKQAFLFGLNLVTLLVSTGKDSAEEFPPVFNWYDKNEMVIKRLKRNPYRQYDHMFSALISLLCIAQRMKISDIEKKIIDSFPELGHMRRKELFEQVPKYYTVEFRTAVHENQNIIFILF